MKLQGRTRWKGVSAGVASSALYGLLAHIIHGSARNMPSTEIMFVRSLSAVIVLLPAAVRQPRRLLSRDALLLWGRAVAAAIALLCLAWNFQHTSVAFANALSNMAPFFVALCVWGIARSSISANIIGDAFLVVLGTFIFWVGSARISDMHVWAIGLLSALAASASAIMLKRAAASWSPYLLAWTLSVVGIPVTLLFKRGDWLPMDTINWKIFVLICVLNLGAQIFLAISFKALEVTTATALGCSAIVWGTFFEIAGRQFPGWAGAVGSIIYMCGMLRLLHEKSDRRTLVALSMTGKV